MGKYIEYNELPEKEKVECDTLVEEAMKPLQKKGFVEKTEYGGRSIWASHVNPRKLIQAVIKGLENKGEELGTLNIGGKTVLLTYLFTIIMNLKGRDEEKDKEIDEYIAGLE